MRENRARTILATGGEVTTGWLTIPSSLSAEMMAHAGWDAVTLDLQHGAINYADAVPMLQAISTSPATPMVRALSNNAGELGRILDAGAYGVICPLINTRAQAEAFVDACRYPPVGHRSVGPLRASLYAGSDYFLHANETVMTMAMIESDEAVGNLDAILETPGLDGIYVGPSDLAVSMGQAPGFDPRYPEVYAAIRHAATRARAKNKIAGIHVGSVRYGQEMRDAGYRFMAYLSEFRLLQWTVSQALPAFRAGTPSGGAP